MVKFVFGKQDIEEGVLSIETTKPLPKIKNRVKEFSVSDGLFKFLVYESIPNSLIFSIIFGETRK